MFRFCHVIDPLNIISFSQQPIDQHRRHLPVLSVLSYFEIFQYPLTAPEIFSFAGNPDLTEENVYTALEKGILDGQVYQFGPYYQTIDAPDWVGKRKDLNDRADQFVPIACRMGRLIGQFPFIRAVMVSGSLSKHSMGENGDIDFFLITTPGRLWVARTLLVLFKKIFLLNSRKYFCVNYFIDTDHLEIEEKNLFTATECATLLPVYGGQWYAVFIKANQWVSSGYFPHFSPRDTTLVPPDKPGRLKRGLEILLQTRFGALLDRWAMAVTLSFWNRKFKQLDTPQFELALKSRTYVSKHHPLSFQEKVLNKYTALMAERSGGNNDNV